MKVNFYDKIYLVKIRLLFTKFKIIVYKYSNISIIGIFSSIVSM